MEKYLVKISAENNNNRYFKMVQISETTFMQEYGAIGAAPCKRPQSMTLWDATLKRKLKEGFINL